MAKVIGRAMKTVKKGEMVEVEFDSGHAPGSSAIIALPDEPPHVAVMRLEIENEIYSKLNAANLEAQRLRTRVKNLEKALQEDTFDNDDFLNRIMDGVANRVTYKLARMIVSGLQGVDDVN